MHWLHLRNRHRRRSRKRDRCRLRPAGRPILAARLPERMARMLRNRFRRRRRLPQGLDRSRGHLQTVLALQLRPSPTRNRCPRRAAVHRSYRRRYRSARRCRDGLYRDSASHRLYRPPKEAAAESRGRRPPASGDRCEARTRRTDLGRLPNRCGHQHRLATPSILELVLEAPCRLAAVSDRDDLLTRQW